MIEILQRVNPLRAGGVQVETLLGDCSKAKRELKWQQKHTFEQLVKEMVESDFALMSRNPLA